MKTITFNFGKKHRERRGRWKAAMEGYIRCSECDVWIPSNPEKICLTCYNYCPKCGANMMGETKDDNS